MLLAGNIVFRRNEVEDDHADQEEDNIEHFKSNFQFQISRCPKSNFDARIQAGVVESYCFSSMKKRSEALSDDIENNGKHYHQEHPPRVDDPQYFFGNFAFVLFLFRRPQGAVRARGGPRQVGVGEDGQVEAE